MVRIPATAGSGPAAGLTATPAVAAREYRVTGIVQGVGFRPFVHRLALRYGLAGWVRNEAGMVRIRVEGQGAALEQFLRALEGEAPPLARLDAVEVVEVASRGRPGFAVLPSTEVDPSRRLPIPADVATCDACLAELRDPADRRHHYPFITCTDCGPRFTVIEDLPYERARTSMRQFAQCPACRREFESPEDRRFHSETNSCPVCGPALWVETDGQAGGRADGQDYARAITAATRVLLAGRILAIRGLGGFHLAVDATDECAVWRLRERKHREAKPLAVMVRTLEEAGRFGVVGVEEELLLLKPARPIVILESRHALARGVHPGLDQIGVMLAYTPLHHLLLEAVDRPLVMTSGNLSEEPLAAGLDEARERLGGIADAFLMHDRDIVTRCDDSVVRPSRAGAIWIRRARGLAPVPLRLPIASPVPLLATGPHLKNTATLVHGDTAFVTPHVGDLENYETLRQFEHLVASSRRLFHIEPEVVVHDLHPGYLSTRIAQVTGLPRIAVQHHHAHVAAVLAEHGVTERVVGLAFDGTGYGLDGAVWGAEVLVADLTGFERAGHLRYAPLPGGDIAARAPWRSALGYLSLEPALGDAFEAAFAGVDPRELALAGRQIARGLNSPRASSMGRLFDAAAAVLGVRTVANYEGQAAMELEALAAQGRGEALPFPIRDTESGFELDPLPLLDALGRLRATGRALPDLAADFHSSVAATAVHAALRAAESAGVTTVALGGGTFQNARLLALVREGLAREGLRVLIAQRLSPNDSAISYGQAAVAAARLHAGIVPADRG
jgi:hydrogenase maturation protein HypF